MHMMRPVAPAESLSDELIVERVLAGEKELYEVIMRRHNQRLFRISRAYVHDENDAEDVVQQAYINAYEHLGKFAGRAQFSTWLTRITINEAIRTQRRASRSVRLEADPAGLREGHEPASPRSPVGEEPDETVMNEELKGVLERTIDGLPMKYRTVFVLREIEELSVAETSASLGISVANVKVRLNRAKEMLRRQIGSVYQAAGVYHFDLRRCDRIVSNVLRQVERY